MWDWLRRRGRHRHNRYVTNNNSDQSWPFNDNSLNISGASGASGSSSRPFFLPSLQMRSATPKCLNQLQCSDILYGARIEDFSPDCWLGEHLHRFGYPPLNNRLEISHNNFNGTTISPLFEDDEESSTGSSESDTTLDYSQFDLNIADTFERMGNQSFRPQHALEELFIPPSERGLMLDLTQPPPYSQFPEEPPPSYEEAIGQHGETSSSGTRSSSSSLAFIW